MSLLANRRILTKILAIVFLLMAVAGGLAALGISSLSSLNDKADNMDAASTRALLAARANQDVLYVNRAEFRTALDPRSENRSAARRVIDEHWRSLLERIDEVARSRDEQARNLVPSVREAIAAYERQMNDTLNLADNAKDFQMAEASERLRDAAMKSRAAAENLQDKVRAVANRLNARVDDMAKQAREEYNSTSRIMIIVAAVGVLAGAAVGFFIGQFGIVSPMRALVGILQRLARGEDVEIFGAERGDEIGDTARAVNGIKEMLAEKALQEARDKEARDQAAAEQRKSDMHKLANEFESAVGNIVETVSSASTELEAAAGTLTHTAEKTQGLSTTVAAASEEASANVNSVASASEELAGSVNEIARQVQESSKIAAEAVRQAEMADGRISELSQAAGRIGDVVKLITAIAEQTNLLALNATIEAARAGEAGKGFAVVAQEVKALAAQTAKATDEISNQIAGMQTTTQDSVTAIKQIGATINRISEIAAAIAAAVEEQGAATQEISRNVQQAAQGTAQVATNITDVNRGATETGSASSQVLSSARSLSSESNHLKLEVNKFLTTVRAA